MFSEFVCDNTPEQLEEARCNGYHPGEEKMEHRVIGIKFPLGVIPEDTQLVTILTYSDAMKVNDHTANDHTYLFLTHPLFDVVKEGDTPLIIPVSPRKKRGR